MPTLKSIEALDKYLSERTVGTLAYRHLTGNDLGNELQAALQHDCEMDIQLVRQCVEAKGWKFDVFPISGVASPSFAIIHAGETTITAYVEPQDVNDGDQLTPIAQRSKWLQTLDKVKRFFSGKGH